MYCSLRDIVLVPVAATLHIVIFVLLSYIFLDVNLVLLVIRWPMT